MKTKSDELCSKKVQLEKKLERLAAELARKQNSSLDFKRKLTEVTEEHPVSSQRLKKFCRQKVGRPRFEDDQPQLLKTIEDIVYVEQLLIHGDDLRSFVATKPLVITADGGPDENPRFPKTSAGAQALHLTSGTKPIIMETEGVVPKKIIPDQADATLDDEKGTQEGHFVGATLQIDGTAPNDNDPDVEFRGAGLSRNRPGSTIGRQSVRSTTSRTSMRPGYIKTEYESKTFFSYKESAFDIAVGICKKELVPAIDGEIQGAWLLTEIDHWDIEREKMVLLCEHSMLIFRYNFITSKVEYWKRVLLHIIDTIFVGDFVYPNYSIMPAREHGGVKICWNNGEMPSFGQRWNPVCATIPWTIFSHHPLLYNPKENETVTYNVDEFYESLIQQVSKVYSNKRPEEKVTVIEGPIVIESYANLASMVYNQSSVGFCRDRNGVSF